MRMFGECLTQFWAKCSASKVWDVLFTFSLVAAVLAKEPFALAPPAFVGFRLFLRYHARGRATRAGGRLATRRSRRPDDRDKAGEKVT